MRALKYLVAAVVMAAPLFLASAPAQAITAHQYQSQGRGHYVSSKARSGGWMRYRMHRHHRHHMHR